MTFDVFWIVLYFIYIDEFFELINIFNVFVEIDINCLIRVCRGLKIYFILFCNYNKFVNLVICISDNG